MRAAQLYTLQQDILRLLAERPRTTVDLLPYISGTRGDVYEMLYRLKADGKIQVDASIPRKWSIRKNTNSLATPREI